MGVSRVTDGWTMQILEQVALARSARALMTYDTDASIVPEVNQQRWRSRGWNMSAQLPRCERELSLSG